MNLLLAALRLYTRYSPFKRGRGLFIRLIGVGARIGLEVPTIEIAPGLLMEFDTSLLGWTVFERGEWEPEQTRLIRGLITPGSVVFDIGANTGYYALLASSAVGPSGQVHAFEMQSAMIEILRRNIKRNGIRNITVVEAACWSTPGEATILAQGDPGSARLDFGNRGERALLTTVDAYAVTQSLSRLDFVLVDAEGADFDVLTGAVSVLEQFRPSVLAETHHLAAFGHSEEAMRAFMTRLGYTARVIQGEYSSDVLFLPTQPECGVE